MATYSEDPMPTTMRDPAALAAEARARFAYFMRAWRLSNSWSGATAERWAAHCPELFPFGAQLRVSRAQWSDLENQRVKSAQPTTFRQLAWLNHRLVQKDRGTAFPDREFRDRIYNAKPVRAADGTPWGEIEFYGAYVGLIPLPPEFAPPEPAHPDPESLRAQFRELAATLPPGVAALRLERLAVAAGADGEAVMQFLEGAEPDAVALEALAAAVAKLA